MALALDSDQWIQHCSLVAPCLIHFSLFKVQYNECKDYFEAFVKHKTCTTLTLVNPAHENTP